jgi:hypothetical protein
MNEADREGYARAVNQASIKAACIGTAMSKLPTQRT